MSEADARDEVLGASQRLLQALMTQNSGALGGFISQEMGFQAVSNGTPFTGQAFLQAIDDQQFPTPASDRLTLGEPQFVLGTGGDASVTYQGEGHMMQLGKRARLGAFVIRLSWMNEGGTWRLTRLELTGETKRGSIGW